MSTRDEIAERYCHGTGLELGPGSVPTKVAEGTRVFYVDKRSKEELKSYFGSEDVVAGDRLEAFEKGTFDFIMAHHVLEHCSNVIDALVVWASYLKYKGTLFLSIPNRRVCADRSRLIATPTHFLADYVFGATDSSFESREHIYSFLWGWHEEGALRGKTKQESHDLVYAAAHSSENDLHWHVFTFQTFKFVLQVAAALAGRSIEFVYEGDGGASGIEHRIVAELAIVNHIDQDVKYLMDLRREVPDRMAQIALKYLDGMPIYSHSKTDAGKLFVAQNGRLRWIREPDVLHQMGLSEREGIYLEVDGLREIYGSDVASTALKLSENRMRAVLDCVPIRSGRGLELSPGARPLVSKQDANVVYCDRVDISSLKGTYGEEAFVAVDSVLGTRLIDDVFANQEFDYIVSSHVLEHIPDFIQFFISARKVLRRGGKIVKLIPDRRFTFDVLRRDSTVDDAEAAYRAKLRYPSLSMIEDYYFNVDNGASAQGLWSGEYKPRPSYKSDEARRLIQTVDPATADLHCWTFTPNSFRRLIDYVISHYVPTLRVIEISDTPRGGNEFLIHLQAE